MLNLTPLLVRPSQTAGYSKAKKKRKLLKPGKTMIHAFSKGSYLPFGGSCLSDLNKPEWLW